jgi:probable addiction module antidote protein
MTNKNSTSLKDPKTANSHLNDALRKLANDNNSEEFLLLLRQLTKIQGGMSFLSKKVGINRQNLYRTFASTGNPKFKSLASILKGLGYRISIEPIPGNVQNLNIGSNDQ